ncbi:hypothetical protein ACNQGP_13270 [Flavobacterium sp. GT2N3]|uniref:hypothetical protein n=1 Tax=unclassified Flavobacterium TaxID=196869 RepID=UPI003AACEECC
MSQKIQEDLAHIRSMMERSSRFISLSGLSGVFAGLFALAGSIYAYQLFKINGIEYFDGTQKLYRYDLIMELVFIALAILILAVGSGIFFTWRKSKKFDLPVWTNTTKKMLLNLAIPLSVGGIFCMALLYHQLFALIAPVTLLFYGLALINAGKYTFSDIRYLGTCEVVLGCISLFYLGFGLIFWAVGFGILHILYGIIVFKKYK